MFSYIQKLLCYIYFYLVYDIFVACTSSNIIHMLFDICCVLQSRSSIISHGLLSQWKKEPRIMKHCNVVTTMKKTPASNLSRGRQRNSTFKSDLSLTLLQSSNFHEWIPHLLLHAGQWLLLQFYCFRYGNVCTSNCTSLPLPMRELSPPQKKMMSMNVGVSNPRQLRTRPTSCLRNN